VDARLHAAIDLEDETDSKSDGGVGLFGLRNGGPEIGMAGAPGGAKGARVRAHQFTGCSPKTAPAENGAEERIAERWIENRAVKNPARSILGVQLRHGHIQELAFTRSAASPVATEPGNT
jgi:hypothetical protein